MKEASLEGLVAATGMSLIATIGDTINDHRYPSLWITMFVCSAFALYVSIGAPLPFNRKRNEP